MLGGGDNDGRVLMVSDVTHNARNKLLHEFEEEGRMCGVFCSSLQELLK